jgi:hypothetical protein
MQHFRGDLKRYAKVMAGHGNAHVPQQMAGHVERLTTEVAESMLFRTNHIYRALYDQLLEILFQLDPIGVHQGDTDKFVPELATMLPRLREARIADDVERIVLEELRRWYGRRRLANLDPERLTDATIASCSAWNHFLAASAR